MLDLYKSITDRWIVKFICLVCMPFSAGVFSSSGEVHVSGNIVTNTCNVSVNDQSKIIDMGAVSNRQFIDGNTTAFPKAFTLSLVDCGPLASGVSVTFQGTVDSNNSQLLSLDAQDNRALGVAIALLDSAKHRIPLNTPTEYYKIEPSENLLTLHFYAQYTANGAPVNAGKANATATFNLMYL